MKYVFIINPISGSINKSDLSKTISDFMSAKLLDFELIETQYAGHAAEYTKLHAKEKNITIVAVGGDGTVNEIASQLIHTNIPLGILPLGSGNGLARHLKLPLNAIKALEVIIEGQTAKIDCGSLNGKAFFVTCGFGFEAQVTQNFNQRNTRGLLGYVKETVKLFPVYNSEEYLLKYNGIEKTRKAFSITVANTSQYGNNAIIAKDASVQDGKLDLCVIKSYPKVFGPQMGLSLFLNNLHNSSFYRTQLVEEMTLEMGKNMDKIHAHIDGEAIEVNLPAEVKCIAGALNILIPKNWM